MQVGVRRGQVDVGQRQAAGRLVDIDPLADARRRAALQLLMRDMVLEIIVLGQADLLAVAGDVEIGARGFERGVLGRIEQFEIAHQLGLAQALDLAGRGETVEEHLPQRQRALVAMV